MAPDSFGVPLVGPAGMPADVTEILRKAFLAMAQDKDYQADAEGWNCRLEARSAERNSQR